MQSAAMIVLKVRRVGWSGEVDVMELNVEVPQTYPATMIGVFHCVWSDDGLACVAASGSKGTSWTPRF